MNLREKLIKHYNFSDADWKETEQRFESLSIPAKTLFLENGKVAKRLAYVRQGLLRSFICDDQANEVTTHFFQEGRVVISIKSFNDQVPTRESIIALEDCQLDVISHKNMLELMEKVPVWKQIGREVDQAKYTAMMNRTIQLQTLSASERYKLFMQKHPDILQRTALGHIASYLGIDIATLSRIRKSI